MAALSESQDQAAEVTRRVGGPTSALLPAAGENHAVAQLDSIDLTNGGGGIHTTRTYRGTAAPSATHPVASPVIGDIYERIEYDTSTGASDSHIYRYTTNGWTLQDAGAYQLLGFADKSAAGSSGTIAFTGLATTDKLLPCALPGWTASTASGPVVTASVHTAGGIVNYAVSGTAYCGTSGGVRVAVYRSTY